jgi:hypothetical protein
MTWSSSICCYPARTGAPCFGSCCWVIHPENDNGTNPLIGLVADGTNLCMAAGDMSDNNQTPLVARTCSTPRGGTGPCGG